jgi:hypothetical protein
MRSLEGANCADLPGFVIDKYFDCNVHKEPLRARIGFAICHRCVVQEACRDEALNMPGLPARGIIGGVAVADIRRARTWRDFENGSTDRVPQGPRPEWLELSDAAQTVEQMRVEDDPDVPGDER